MERRRTATEGVRAMTNRAIFRSVLSIGVLAAIGCRTPSSVSATPNTGLSASTAQVSNASWPAPAPGKTYTLMPTPQTVAWGWYDAAGEPVLRVASGDEVVVRALSTCAPRSLVSAGLDSNRVEQVAKDIYAARDKMKTGPGGHILTGPIYVEGADSGDVLEVRFKDIRPAINYGCNSFGPRSGFLKDDFTTSRSKIIELDTVRMLGKFNDAVTIPLHP